MKSFALPILLAAHGLTRIGLNLPDQTWHIWVTTAQTSRFLSSSLFAIHLAADLGLFLWILGPEKGQILLRALAHPIAAWAPSSRSSERKHPALRA